MFDKLIDSAPVRRKRRLIRFFFGTSLLYLSVITAVLVISVLVTNPELAETSDLKATILVPPPKKGESEPTPARQEPTRQARPDIYHPAPLDEAINRATEEPTRDRSNNPPTTAQIPGGPGYPDGVDKGDPNSQGFIPGFGGERRNISPDPIEPPPPPPPPAAKRSSSDEPAMIKVPSKVLQGKAIDRRTPAYPRLAITAKVEGQVSVEVVISPEGRVEVARAISGHALLKPAAAEAARSWRFQPTLLNGVPVRVTGIITFVFKIDG